jgi:hypothetical protein
MSDTTVTTEAPILTLPPEAPLQNSPEARTPDGTLKDQTTLTGETTTTPTEPKTPSTTESKATDTYADFKLPDGVAVNADVLKDATTIFKELNLPQDAAQKLVDLYVKDQKSASEAPQNAFKEMTAGWRNDVLKDPNLSSGDGLRPDVNENIGKLKASLGDKAAIDKFNEVMNMSGLGNHPAIVSALNTWGKALSEGKHVEGKGPSPLGQRDPAKPERPSAAKAMFPNLPG